MNTSINKNIGEWESLLRDAASVFSKGLIERIKSEGLAMLEKGGHGSVLVDSTGKEYIDCFTSAGSFNLGRGRADLLRVLRESARQTDQGNFIAISEEKAMLAQRLASFMPPALECALFTVVRGEAMDAACKLARGFTGRSEIITVDGGWYGHTGFSLGMSDCCERDLFGQGIPKITAVPFGDVDAARRALTKNTAAFVLETVQAENGCRYAEEEYYASLRRLCDEAGAILIVDESQTGFGRTGYRFSFDCFKFIPDIAVLGEAITGGMFPMTAIAFTGRLKSFFDEHPLIHLCTFGGHDVGCRVAVSAIDLYVAERPWENARRMGGLLFERLDGISTRYPGMVCGIEGKGLLFSITMKDEVNARRFCVEAGGSGFVCARGRVNGSSVVLRPVLTISEDDVRMIAEAVENTLKTMNKG